MHSMPISYQFWSPFWLLVSSTPIQNLKDSIVALNYGVAKVIIDATDNDMIEVGSVGYDRTWYLLLTVAADWVGGVFVRDAIGVTQAQLQQVEVLALPGEHAWSINATEAWGAWRNPSALYLSYHLW